MIRFLYISIFLLTFALWIGGSSYPSTRGKPIAPSTSLTIGGIKSIGKMTKRKTVDKVKSDFIERWGDLYDYSNIIEYKSNKQKLPILCKEHGIFMMSSNDHLRGHGCPKCRDEATSKRCKMSREQFIERATKIHKGKYCYDLVTEGSYNNSKELQIICPIHGVFKQNRHDHISGRGCYKCGKLSMASKQRYTRDELVGLFNQQFNNRYDYSLFKDEDYKRKKDKIKVICKKHGVFEVSVDNHLYRHSGCPKCKHSFGEERIAKFLVKNKIEHKEQYRINNEYLLCQNKTLIVDFYLPKYNTIIEFNGIQHYEESPLFDMRSFNEQNERDNAVRQYCKDHKIKLIEIPYTEIENIDNILATQLKIK